VSIIIKYLVGLIALWHSSLSIEMHDSNNDGIVSSVGGMLQHDYAHSFDISGNWNAVSYTYKSQDPYRIIGDTSNLVRFDILLLTGETQVIFFASNPTASHYLYFLRDWRVSMSEGVGIDWNTTSLNGDTTATLRVAGIPVGVGFYDSGDITYN
jgi:hypothetical protein